jgi:hypothetical protein
MEFFLAKTQRSYDTGPFKELRISDTGIRGFCLCRCGKPEGEHVPRA